MRYLLLILYAVAAGAADFDTPIGLARLSKSAAGGGGGGDVVNVASVGTSAAAIAVSTLVTTNVVASGTDRYLLIWVGCGDDTAGDRVVVSVSSSLDGACTKIDSQDDGTFTSEELWGKVNPTVGTHEITVTWTGEVLDGACCSASLTNVNQSTPTGTVVKSSPNTSTPSASPTLVSGDLGVCGIATDSESSLSATTGTERWVKVGINSDVSFGGSTITGSGATAMSWSQSPSALCSIVAVPIKKH